MVDVLGLNPFSPVWDGTDGTDDRLRRVVDGLVGALIADRAQARADRDWAAADAIRDRLAGLGVELTDSPDGTRWSLGEEG